MTRLQAYNYKEKRPIIHRTSLSGAYFNKDHSLTTFLNETLFSTTPSTCAPWQCCDGDCLTKGSAYNLDFTLGDANNVWEGEFIVDARTGSKVQNFTVRSNGTGSPEKYSIKFEAGSSATDISFSSFTSSQTKDGMFRGPVVDDVVLACSLPNVLISLLLLIVLLW